MEKPRNMPARRRRRVAPLLAIVSLPVACAPALVRPAVGFSPRPVADTYSCMLRELGRAGYRVVDADREAGFAFAERQIDAPDLLDVGRYAWDEVTLVALPRSDGLSEVQITSSRSTQEPGEARTGSTAGIPSPTVAQVLLDACGGEITESG